MSVIRAQIRRGAYADSIVLMHLQSSLAALPGVEDAGAVMGTAANLELLAGNELQAPEFEDVAPDDLVLVVRAESAAAADEALGRVDELLAARRGGEEAEFRPRSLSSAARLLPAAGWVLVSVPGRFAARLAGEALDLGRHVFLYSDNVPLADEVALKRRAREAGLLVMGPDCGTAIVGGVGFGFANRVRRGGVGIVAASGTGLQAIACRVHALGGGVSQAIGTGGRDLHAEVGGVTALQGLEVLRRDPETRVIVLVSKPPAPAVAGRLLAAARTSGKPVVVHFIGQPRPAREPGRLFFSAGLSEAASMAAALARKVGEIDGAPSVDRKGAEADEIQAPAAPAAAEPRFLRALFAGGTLALETQQALGPLLSPMWSNAPILGSEPLDAGARSRGHTVLDLGADELTVGRLHPMIDQELRLRMLRREAADAEVGLLLLDVVLGEGSHPDPAAELAPVIEEVRAERPLDVAVLMIGTDEDPQDMAVQAERLRAAGAEVFESVSEGLAWVAGRLVPASGAAAAPATDRPRIDLAPLRPPIAAINVGLETFYDSLVDQGAQAVQVEWRPPAGGDERLMALLDRMR